MLRWPKLWKYSIDLLALVDTRSFQKEKGRTVKFYHEILY